MVWETREGRPFRSCAPLQLVATLVVVVTLAIVALALVMTGPVVDAVGGSLGIGHTALTIWDLAKWPVLLAVLVGIIGLLYYASPNVEVPGFGG